ncbi:MAG TPA: response regulator, partial [Candidatus Paceibacterota bacterium]|nr:response regulator [Candidatus Paceibacterota bacterium]HRZ91949.1 response regulator [Candidatus Paceibacterota bacterium]
PARPIPSSKIGINFCTDPQVKPARVLLVDDHPAILQQVAQLLREEFDVVDALPDGARLEAALARSHPDLVVLDISMPGLTGIELARRMTDAGCPARIVFLTVHADADYARAAFAAGAFGYVVKLRLGCDLAPALRAAMAGQRFVSRCPELEELLGSSPGSIGD